MDQRDLARIEYYRRWLRPDWRRFVRPDWERHVHPAGHAAMRKDFALRDRAFETPMARRWREEKEQREREEQERLDAEQREQIEHEALELKAELAELRFELTMRRLAWEAECAEHKRWADAAWKRVMAAFMRGDFAPRQKANFNPNQPRVPAGNPDGGQWSNNGAEGPEEARDVQSSPKPDQTRLAQYSIGTLIGQSRVRGGGSVCFYKFSFGTIMAPGPTNLSCPTWVPAAGVSHGKLIANDN